MKLLIDQNLSHRLVDHLRDLFPDSMHVRHAGLERATDDQVWEFARVNEFVILTKDSDFHERSMLLRHPPKVIWFRRGNCSTDTVAAVMRDRRDALVAFAADDALTVMVVL